MSQPAMCEREKGDGTLLCVAPIGPFRQKSPVPFFVSVHAYMLTCTTLAGGNPLNQVDDAWL